MNKDNEIEKIEKCIGDLVYEKVALKKAYNYYHGIRDAEQFRHIESNYGIGTPTSVGFTPLIKKHIDVLVGEYLELDPEMQVVCTDDTTISYMMRDKQLKINQEVYDYIGKYLKNAIINIILKGDKPVNDPFIEKELQKIANEIDQNYVSEYEKAAQNILEYIKHSRDIDLKNKLRELFTDLLITGVCYYRVKPSGKGDSLDLEILNPLDTFIERNRNEYYLNKSPRCVVRRWLTEEQILSEFGNEMKKDAKEELKFLSENVYRNYNTVYVRAPREVEFASGIREVNSTGILGGLETTPVFPWDDSGDHAYNGRPVISVMECQWLEYENDRIVRHEGIKIGDSIYITRGTVDENKKNDRNGVDLTVNGIFFQDKNGNPFSIELSTMDLQDQYDLILYYRNNAIASSGTIGDWIDVAHLPAFLGQSPSERLVKWLAYKKNGIALFDSSQEGAQALNTTFNGFDDTVRVNAIQAMQMALESIENQASSITGVFAEKLGGIQQRDAVSNVKVGIRQSTLLTKQYFTAMDLLYKEVNYDLLNLAKTVFKKGLSGTIILGHKLKKVFTALPEYYTTTDFDIHIQDSTETFNSMQNLNQLNLELVKAGLIEPDVSINVALARNVSEIRGYMDRSVAKQKAENDMNQQLQQQLQQYEQQIKQSEQQMQQLQQQLQQLQNKLERNNEQKLAIEQEKVKNDRQKIDNDKEYNDQLIETKKKQLAIELAQTHDGNPYNDVIRDVV